LRFGLSSNPRPTNGDHGETSPAAIGEVCLSARDSGVGIPPELLGRVFEPFFTTKPTGLGTGLGLTIVKAIIQGLGGRIDVESQVDHGTTFTIRLPRIAPPVAANCGAHARQQLPRGRGEAILVAEDNSSVMHVMSGSLRQAGFEVVEAVNATEALAQYAHWQSRIRLLILDVDLPKGSGVEVLRKIRRMAPAIPAIIVTGHVNHDLDSVIDDRTRVLRKPYRLLECMGLAAEFILYAATVG
jgi:CheY-like chemotaxis protein